MIIRAAVLADWKSIQSLLLSAGLPTDDLGPDKLRGFLVAEQNPGGPVAGLAGLQQLSRDIGLLRSLAVAAPATGRGIGSQLVAALERAAREADLDELWLLTIDADGYFRKYGYEIIDRATAPDVLRETPEFSGLCPDDAFLMRKYLAVQ